MKETYYFPHDYNASQDTKIVELLDILGPLGLGLYWIIIEHLHQQPDGKISFQSFVALIRTYSRMATNFKDICDTLLDTGLLLQVGDHVTSKRVLQNKRYRDKVSEQRSLAGKASAIKRQFNTCSTDNPTAVKICSTGLGTDDEQYKENKTKVKEITDTDKRSTDHKPDPFHSFMDRAIEKLLGINPKDKAAVSAAYRRYGKAARDILAFAGGDADKAYTGTNEIGRYMESRSLTWNLDTAAKWFPDWMQGGLNGEKRKD